MPKDKKRNISRIPTRFCLKTISLESEMNEKMRDGDDKMKKNEDFWHFL